MANSADPDHLASSKANWSGSTLFAKAVYIWVQQDKGIAYLPEIFWTELPEQTVSNKTHKTLPYLS